MLCATRCSSSSHSGSYRPSKETNSCLFLPITSWHTQQENKSAGRQEGEHREADEERCKRKEGERPRADLGKLEVVLLERLSTFLGKLHALQSAIRH